jgi:hypothetical protein
LVQPQGQMGSESRRLQGRFAPAGRQERSVSHVIYKWALPGLRPGRPPIPPVARWPHPCAQPTNWCARRSIPATGRRPIRRKGRTLRPIRARVPLLHPQKREHEATGGPFQVTRCSRPLGGYGCVGEFVDRPKPARGVIRENRWPRRCPTPRR